MGAKKALLAARFVVEAHSGAGELVVNEDLAAPQKRIVDELYELVGPYKLYSESEAGMDFATEAGMRAAVAKRFARFKDTLQDSLSCEDYEQEGVLDLVQLKEAILGVDEDIDWHLLDYMLWYVYVRSDSVDRLEYKVLLTLIDDQTKKQQRPQSSKHQTVKSSGKAQEAVSSEEEDDDKYSEVDEGKESGVFVDSPIVQGGDKDLLDGGAGVGDDQYEESPRQKVPSPPQGADQRADY